MMLDIVVHIPDWLLNGPYWAGFLTATILAILLAGYALSHLGPRF
jgi:hypothetical protein